MKCRPLVNHVASSPKGAMFLKAKHCIGGEKDSNFIADMTNERLIMKGNLYGYG
jgi:hypothetical protein